VKAAGKAENENAVCPINDLIIQKEIAKTEQGLGVVLTSEGKVYPFVGEFPQ